MAFPYKRSLDFVVYAWLAWMLYRTLQFYFFPTTTGLTRYKRKARAYALITGASGGIGYGFAQELVGHGFNVILLANKKDKLQRIANQLRSESPGAVVETISFNVLKGGVDELESALRPYVELPITIVINNVAALPTDPPYKTVNDTTASEVNEMINANVTFMTQVTRIMLPTLIRNGPSAIVHMGSGAYYGVPYMSTYSGSKGWVASFATALAREAVAEGWQLDSIAVVPGDVHSEGNAVGLGPGSPTSRQYAKMTLDRIETAADRKMRVIYPFWMHAVLFTLIEKLPERLVQSMLTGTIKEKWNLLKRQQ